MKYSFDFFPHHLKPVQFTRRRKQDEGCIWPTDQFEDPLIRNTGLPLTSCVYPWISRFRVNFLRAVNHR